MFITPENLTYHKHAILILNIQKVLCVIKKNKLCKKYS